MSDAMPGKIWFETDKHSPLDDVTALASFICEFKTKEMELRSLR